MPRRQKWPAELKKPLIMEQIDKGISPRQRVKHFETDRLIAIDSDFRWRAEIMADFLRDHFRDDDFPLNPFAGTDDKWLSLLVRVCNYWKINAFQVEMVKPRGAGASKFWTDQKICELFADIQSVVRQNNVSEYSAARHVANNPADFGNRYFQQRSGRPGGSHTTIYRQFNYAKSKIKSNADLRSVKFVNLDYGPSLIEWAVKRYAFSEVRRRAAIG